MMPARSSSISASHAFERRATASRKPATQIGSDYLALRPLPENRIKDDRIPAEGSYDLIVATHDRAETQSASRSAFRTPVPTTAPNNGQPFIFRDYSGPNHDAGEEAVKVGQPHARWSGA